MKKKAKNKKRISRKRHLLLHLKDVNKHNTHQITKFKLNKGPKQQLLLDKKKKFKQIFLYLFVSYMFFLIIFIIWTTLTAIWRTHISQYIAPCCLFVIVFLIVVTIPIFIYQRSKLWLQK